MPVFRLKPLIELIVPPKNLTYRIMKRNTYVDHFICEAVKVDRENSARNYGFFFKKTHAINLCSSSHFILILSPSLFLVGANLIACTFFLLVFFV